MNSRDSKVVRLETRLTSPAERQTRTHLDTIEITLPLLDTWEIAPEVQRPLRVTKKVEDCGKKIAEDGVIPGLITIAYLDGRTYICDGQHRLHAFRLSQLESAYADVRIYHVESMAEMGRIFDEINASLVPMRPDDRLRAISLSLPPVQHVIAKCPFVGFDHVRRNPTTPIVSLSVVLRTWATSTMDIPGQVSESSRSVAERLIQDEADALVEVLTCCYGAWGRDPEYGRLWSALNLTLCMWLYRRMVLGFAQTGASRMTRVSKGVFSKGLMSLSANSDYIDWLLGRGVRESDRGPCYHRVKVIMGKRMEQETGKRVLFPSGAWVSR